MSSPPPLPPQDIRQTFARPGLRKITPYWHPYRTNAKERWLGREMLELVSTEFRDRSVEYYRYALDAGVITVNGKKALKDTVVRNGDQIENIVHRHEPPVTDRPVKIIHVDKEKQFIVIDKPGSIPVHATGRYFKNSLVEILRSDHGIEKPYTVNRLDRLTSGLMIIATSSARARVLCDEFLNRAIQKEYIARCRGCFPEEEIVVDQPMLTVDRQMGLNIVHPEGKPAKTIFSRLFYDAKTDSSVIHCKPVTGRSHQIRVHLQFLGYPIANDPVYSDNKVWGPKLGRGGLDLSRTDIFDDPSASITTAAPKSTAAIEGPFTPQLVHDMGVLAEVSLSAEAVHLLASMRNINPPASMRSELQGTLTPGTPVLGESGSGAASPGLLDALAAPYSSTSAPSGSAAEPASQQLDAGAATDTDRAKALPRETGEDIGSASPVPLTREATGVIQRLRNKKDEGEDWSRWRDVIFRAKKALAPVLHGDSKPEDGAEVAGGFEPAVHVTADGRETLYCPECFLPLHPDPLPEQLYIFLHAKKYSTDAWSFETEMPEWAVHGYEWER